MHVLSSDNHFTLVRVAVEREHLDGLDCMVCLINMIVFLLCDRMRVNSICALSGSLIPLVNISLKNSMPLFCSLF